MTEAQAAESEGEQILFEGRPAAVPNAASWLLVVLTVGLAFVYFWMKSLGTHYRVTTKRVVIERGVLSKRMEQIDLYRIVDYVVDRPFFQRLAGTGNLVLHTMDRTSPLVELHGVKTDVAALYEKVRAASEVEKRRRGVRIVDNE